MDLQKIETELKKRLDIPYLWGMKQNDIYDTMTNFIYNVTDFNELLNTIKERFDRKERYGVVYNYALNRWFNFWSAHAIEYIFCSLPNVVPAKNKNDKLLDFEIHGIKFDHKTTVYPKKYNKTIKEARANPVDLVEWLYDNQSQQKRMHLKNRLFIVLYARSGKHWKLKAEITWLKGLIEKYMNNFDTKNLIKYNVNGNDVIADIIWGVK
jgi:hypothetical protein